MKICLVNPFDIWTATGIRLINIGNFLHKKGHEVTLISTKRRIEKLPQPIQFDLIEVPPPVGSSEKLFLHKISHKRISYAISSVTKFFSLLDLDFDIIHASKTIPQATLPSLVASRLKSKKIVVDWDDWEGKEGLGRFMPPVIREVNTIFEQKIIHYVDGTIVDSKFLYNYLLKIKYKKPIAYIPNGINLKNYKNVKKIKLPENSVVIVGSLSGISDLDCVLPAIALALKKVDINLLVIGEGDRRKEFEKYCKKLGIDKSVHFLGWVDEKKKKQILKSSDIALMPMRNNIQNKARSPMKLPEYMALGCAIISNPVGEIKTILDGAGLLVGYSKEDFANGIIKLIEDKNLRKTLKRKARKRVKMFDWNILLKEIEVFYETVLHSL